MYLFHPDPVGPASRYRDDRRLGGGLMLRTQTETWWQKKETITHQKCFITRSVEGRGWIGAFFTCCWWLCAS